MYCPRWTRRLAGSAACLLAAMGAARPAPPTGPHRVETVTGTVHHGRLLAFTPDWKVRLLVSAAKELTLDARDMRSIVRQDVRRQTDAAGLCLVFPNGDRIRATLIDGTAEVIQCRHERIGPVQVAVKRLAALFWADRASDVELARWVSDMLAARGAQDRVWLRNNDRLRGVVGAVTPRHVELTGELGTTRVPTGNVRAVVFSSETCEFVVPETFHAVLTLRDGSRLGAARLTGDGDTFDLVTLFGARLKVSALDVVACEFRNGRIVYLSDLKPTEYAHQPFLTLSWPWRADRAVGGGPLRIRGQLFRKGLGMHSKSRLVFRLDGAYRQFQALVGVDDEARDRGSVVFRVRVDDQVRFTSPVLTGTSPPQDVSLPLAGAKQLVLEVDYGPDGDVLDRADWADARLLR